MNSTAWRRLPAYSSGSTGMDAGRRAALDLVLQARAVAVAEVVVGAAPQQEVLLDDFQGLAHGHRGSVGAEVAAAVLDDAAGGEDARPVAPGHLDAQVALVVLEADVVARLVLLDEVVLEDQRFLLVAGHQGLDVLHLAHEEGHVRAAVAAPQVGAHPRAQLLGLAHVNDLAAAVPHQVDAGPGGQRVELVLQFLDVHDLMGPLKPGQPRRRGTRTGRTAPSPGGRGCDPGAPRPSRTPAGPTPASFPS